MSQSQILIQSVCETMVPKLVSDDIPLLHSLLSDVFPGVRYTRAEMGALRKEIARVCSEMHLVAGETGQQWVEKVRLDCDSLCVWCSSGNGSNRLWV